MPEVSRCSILLITALQHIPWETFHHNKYIYFSRNKIFIFTAKYLMEVPDVFCNCYDRKHSTNSVSLEEIKWASNNQSYNPHCHLPNWSIRTLLIKFWMEYLVYATLHQHKYHYFSKTKFLIFTAKYLMEVQSLLCHFAWRKHSTDNRTSQWIILVSNKHTFFNLGCHMPEKNTWYSYFLYNTLHMQRFTTKILLFKKIWKYVLTSITCYGGKTFHRQI